jgi:hypothetical protein
MSSTVRRNQEFTGESAIEYLEQVFEECEGGLFHDDLYVDREIVELIDDHEETCWICSDWEDDGDPESMCWRPPPDGDYSDPDGDFWYHPDDIVVRHWDKDDLPAPADFFSLGPEYPTRTCHETSASHSS